VAGLLKRRGLKPYQTTKCKGQENGWFFNTPKSAIIAKPSKVAIRLGGRSRINSMPLDTQQSAQSRGVSDEVNMMGG